MILASHYREFFVGPRAEGSKEWGQCVRSRQKSADDWEYDHRAHLGNWSDWIWSTQREQWGRHSKDPDGNWQYDYELAIGSSSAGSNTTTDKGKGEEEGKEKEEKGGGKEKDKKGKGKGKSQK